MTSLNRLWQHLLGTFMRKAPEHKQQEQEKKERKLIVRRLMAMESGVRRQILPMTHSMTDAALARHAHIHYEHVARLSSFSGAMPPEDNFQPLPVLGNSYTSVHNADHVYTLAKRERGKGIMSHAQDCVQCAEMSICPLTEIKKWVSGSVSRKTTDNPLGGRIKFYTAGLQAPSLKHKTERQWARVEIEVTTTTDPDNAALLLILETAAGIRATSDDRIKHRIDHVLTWPCDNSDVSAIELSGVRTTEQKPIPDTITAKRAVLKLEKLAKESQISISPMQKGETVSWISLHSELLPSGVLRVQGLAYITIQSTDSKSAQTSGSEAPPMPNAADSTPSSTDQNKTPPSK